MSTVWIHSPSRLIARAVGDLLTSLGYQVQFEPEPPSHLALWDLSCCEPPYPQSTAIPALALLRGDEETLVLEALSGLGYRSYLHTIDADVTESLKKALESLIENQARLAQETTRL